MNINEQNIINRWNLMASKDLGTRINPLTQEFARFFNMVFNEGYETGIDLNKHNFSMIQPILTGYAINNEGLTDIKVITCLDINCIEYTKTSIEEFEWDLMNDSQVCLHGNNWLTQYEFALTIK